MSLIYGKSGVVKKGTTTLTNIENIRMTVEADAVVARSMGSDFPDQIISGAKTVRGEIGKFYLGPTDFFDDFISGAELTIEVYPEGAGAGKPKYTVTGAIIESWGYDHPYNDFVRERVRFMGRSIAKGIQS
jgi:hypothetical protein